MRIVVICQEEPIFLGPFVAEVIRHSPDRITHVIIAGPRSAGERGGSFRERMEALRTFWLLFEPVHFLGALARRCRSAVLGGRDPRSVERMARIHGIPVHHLARPVAADLAPVLRSLEPDLVLNQSEILLGEDILSIPSIGVVNRHATLLPRHRGRLGSFWAHAEDDPRYGVTIHMVDAGIDTGEVLVQWEATDVDPGWPFPRILWHLNRRAPDLFWEGVARLERGEGPTPQPPGGDRPPRRFPTLEEARRYRHTLRRRRASVGEDDPGRTGTRSRQDDA